MARRMNAVAAMLAMIVGVGGLTIVTAQFGAAAPAPSASGGVERGRLAGVASWGYQLQNADPAVIAASPYDLVVIDYSRNGTDAQRFTAAEVALMQKKPDGSRRIVLAYLSVGEAEDYRYYWQQAWEKNPPAWMGSPNCRWKGDHRVRHWAPEWQAIIFGTPKSYVGRLIDAGYDGAWLDRVDIFYYWRSERWQAAADMVTFVDRLGTWARGRNPDFLIVPQNGEELVADARYRAAIDGMGKEDMLFGDRGNDTRNAEPRIDRARRNFAPAQKAGLKVLAIEYARKAEHMAAARKELGELRFVPYFGPRSLAYIGHDGTPHKEDGDTEATVADQGDESCG